MRQGAAPRLHAAGREGPAADGAMRASWPAQRARPDAAPGPIGRAVTRVVIAEPDATVRDVLRAILNTQADWEVVGEARDSTEALVLIQALQPHLVILSIDIPPLGGVDAVQEIKHVSPQSHILLLTLYEDEPHAFRLMRVGATGYISKHATAPDLLEAARTSVRGRARLSPRVAAGVARDRMEGVGPGEEGAPTGGFTDRQRAILSLTAAGRSAAHIGYRLKLDPETVRQERAGLVERFGLNDPRAVVTYAVRRRLIGPDATPQRGAGGPVATSLRDEPPRDATLPVAG